MNIKKAIISAILVLGSATLIAGGRNDFSHEQTSFSAASAAEEAEILGAQLSTYAEDSFFQLLGV